MKTWRKHLATKATHSSCFALKRSSSCHFSENWTREYILIVVTSRVEYAEWKPVTTLNGDALPLLNSSRYLRRPLKVVWGHSTGKANWPLPLRFSANCSEFYRPTIVVVSILISSFVTRATDQQQTNEQTSFKPLPNHWNWQRVESALINPLIILRLSLSFIFNAFIEWDEYTQASAPIDFNQQVGCWIARDDDVGAIFHGSSRYTRLGCYVLLSHLQVADIKGWSSSLVARRSSVGFNQVSLVRYSQQRNIGCLSDRLLLDQYLSTLLQACTVVNYGT